MSDGSVHIRAARAADTPAMALITRDVWNGTDYLPFVWHAWLESTRGYLMVAESRGRVVGLQHVVIQDDNSAWLEGIRVAAEVQGSGVGGALLAHGIEWARGMGCETARLSTASSNPASTRLAERAGMNLVARFTPLSATVAQREEPPLVTAQAEDAGQVFDHLVAGIGPAHAGFYTEGWTAYRLTLERVRLLCAMRAVAVVRAGPDIRGTLVATCMRPFRTVSVGAVTGDAGTVSRLARFARSNAGALGFSRIRAILAGSDDVMHALQAEGFEKSRDFEMRVYEAVLASV
ncbi:MAG: hypothetical protein NVSMB22_22020 [Chloroflexota bacterium]